MTADATLELNGKRKIKSAGLLKNRAVMLVLSDNLLGESYLLRKKITVVGRGSDCDMIIKDPLVSKKHCRISSDEESIFFIEDLGSKNSTYLNGRAVTEPVHISYGDRIIIGNTIMRFFLAENFESR